MDKSLTSCVSGLCLSKCDRDMELLNWFCNSYFSCYVLHQVNIFEPILNFHIFHALILIHLKISIRIIKQYFILTSCHRLLYKRPKSAKHCSLGLPTFIPLQELTCLVIKPLHIAYTYSLPLVIFLLHQKLCFIQTALFPSIENDEWLV